MSSTARQIKKSLADAIRKRMAREGVSLSAFSRKINTERNALRRLLDVKSTSITLNTMVKTAEALDLELTLTIKPLPLANISSMVRRLTKTKSARQAAALKRQIITGYYGRPGHRAGAQNPAVRFPVRTV